MVSTLNKKGSFNYLTKAKKGVLISLTKSSLTSSRVVKGAGKGLMAGFTGSRDTLSTRTFQGAIFHIHISYIACPEKAS
jgi:hypothetical protein